MKASAHACDIEQSLIRQLQSLQAPTLNFDFDLEKGISSYTVWQSEGLFVFGLKNGKVGSLRR